MLEQFVYAGELAGFRVRKQFSQTEWNAWNRMNFAEASKADVLTTVFVMGDLDSESGRLMTRRALDFMQVCQTRIFSGGKFADERYDLERRQICPSRLHPHRFGT
jgi:hypothetical protein